MTHNYTIDVSMLMKGKFGQKFTYLVSEGWGWAKSERLNQQVKRYFEK